MLHDDQPNLAICHGLSPLNIVIGQAADRPSPGLLRAGLPVRQIRDQGAPTGRKASVLTAPTSRMVPAKCLGLGS